METWEVRGVENATRFLVLHFLRLVLHRVSGFGIGGYSGFKKS
jgi:hypothetical protein